MLLLPCCADAGQIKLVGADGFLYLAWSMYKLFIYMVLLSSGLCFGQGGEKPVGFKTLAIGDKAPAFRLPGTDGKTYKLSDFKKYDVLMVYFTGTHCPTSHGAEIRIQQLLRDTRDRGFGIVAINPNHNDGLRADEFSYSKYTESFQDSKRYAEDLGWTFPFLYDGEKQLVARAYGCLATPHVFIFDKDRKLRYKGRFDDSRYREPETVKSPDARNAVEALLAGKPVPVAETRPMGCSTKWREKKVLVDAERKKWFSEPAVIEEIDLAGVAALRKNGTNKLRLINVWASWCAPCREEMPDFTRILRKYNRRNFEVITISLDEVEHKARAEKFLTKHGMVLGPKNSRLVKKEGRRTNNYLLTGASSEKLVEALDPKWPGPIPYTILVDSKGEIVMRVSGKIDPVVLDEKIIEILTPYWQPKKKASGHASKAASDRKNTQSGK